MSRLDISADVAFADALQNLLPKVTARVAVPLLADCIADLCLRAGVSQSDRLLLAQLAMEVVTERLDHSGCFDGAYND